MGGLVETKATGGLTDRQNRLVDALLTGKSEQEAWEAAGYATRQSFINAMRSPAVQTALFEDRRGRITGAIAEKALAAITQIIESDSTPAATRFSAAKWVLEQAGHVGQDETGRDVPIHEMTSEQLVAFMARAQAVVDGGGEAPLIAIAPDNGALST